MADLQFVGFAVCQVQQFGLPDDFCKIDDTILSRMSHPASGFPVVFREFKQRRRRRFCKRKDQWWNYSSLIKFVKVSFTVDLACSSKSCLSHSAESNLDNQSPLSLLFLVHGFPISSVEFAPAKLAF